MKVTLEGLKSMHDTTDKRYMELPFTRNSRMKLANDVLEGTTLKKLATVKEEALAILKPTREELKKVASVTDRVIKHISHALNSQDIPVLEIEPQGSTGIKQTQLAGDFDVDVFIILDRGLIKGKGSKKAIRSFNKELFTGYINNLLIPTSREALKAKKVTFSYAEHPYLTITVDGIKFDLVFCYQVTKEDIKRSGIYSAMDRTPLHSIFVRDHLDINQKDDVRLMKAFFKAHHVYGDRSACGRMGFIGYATELLIFHFGTLENLLVNFDMLCKVPIDYHGRPDSLVARNNRFSNDYLIITDPTDPSRNVGSSIDKRAVLHARKQVNEFLKEPNVDFFITRSIPSPPNMDPHFQVVTFNNSQDVHYTIVRDKLYKLGNNISTSLERETTGEERFGTLTHEVVFPRKNNMVALAFHVSNPIISDSYVHRGPKSTIAPERIRGFLDKHPNAQVDSDDYYYIIVKREETTFTRAASRLIQELLDIDGLTTRSGSPEIPIVISPAEHLGRQAIHVLKTMVIPHANERA
ncbi:hypothetical protein GF325_16905 [Candidatus Bathyarchaeota archaeon]|nr:hypothetical protein [Candidatus Bathyarchaeota archaeon]